MASDPSAASSSSAAAPGQYFYQGFRKRGFSPVQAAVLVGNVQQESSFNPTAYNARENAGGLLQWRQDRLAGLLDYAAATKRQPGDPDTQMDYVVHEMTRGPEARNAAAFLNASDATSANAALKRYVRYGDNSQNARLQNAMAFMPNGSAPAAPANGDAGQGGQAGNGPAGGFWDGGSGGNGNSGGSSPPPAASPGGSGAPPATPVAGNQSSGYRGNVGQNAGLSRDQFLQQWGAAPSSSGTGASTGSTTSNPGTSPDRAAFLQSWGVPSDNTGTPPAASAAAPSAPQQGPVATGPGTFAGKPVTLGALGNNPMARGKPSPAPAAASGPSAGPSSMPWLDPISAFANAAVDAIPVVGPGLTAIGNNVDASINNLMGYPTETAADRAGINAANAKANPLLAGAGSVAGTVAPFMLAGPEGLAAKALGTASDYGFGGLGNMLTRGLAGGFSGAAITGADTAARGGDANAVAHNALTGGELGAVAAPAMHAIGNVGDAAAQWYLGRTAPQSVARAMTQDGMSPANVNLLTQQMGPGAMVADLGPNTQALAGSLASQPGNAQSIVRQNIAARTATTGDRINQDVTASLGAGTPVGQLTDKIIAAQKAAADPLYAAVRSQPVKMTGILQSIASRPLGKEALNAATESLQNQGIAVKGTTVGLLDAAKQWLDDYVSSNLRAGFSNKARIADDLAAQITDQVDQQVPGYAAARAAYAGPAKVLDAINYGTDAFTKKVSPEELQSTWADMSPSEKDGLLQGAQSAVQQIMGNSKTDAQGVFKAFGDSNAQEKLAVLVGQDKADAIARTLQREAVFAATNAGVNRGAAQGAAAAAANDVAVPKSELGRTTTIGTLLSAFSAARSLLRGSLRAGTNEDLAKLLTQPLSPEDAKSIAAASLPGAGGIAGAAVPLAAKNSLPPGTNMLTWAYPHSPVQDSDPSLPPGPGGSQPPLRITVRGATQRAQ